MDGARLLRAQAMLRAVTAAFASLSRMSIVSSVPFCLRRRAYRRDTVLINGKEVTVVDAFTRLNAPQNMAGVPAISIRVAQRAVCRSG